MVMHPTRRELYISVPGKNHILKVNVDSGQFARTAREEYPIYSNKLPSFEYSIWECVTQEIFASNINQPTGMVFSLDYERLFVAERGTGNIIVYEVNTGDLLYTISTQFNTIGGIDISPNGNELYFVDDETDTLNVISVVTECDITYTPRTNPEYISELEKAKLALGVNDPFKLLASTNECKVDPIVPNITFFDQVHLDTGYASDDPNVQSVMAGMDAAALLLKNRTDCEYDSELNFDALLLGGYFCHTCLPNQDQICNGGGSCINIQWEGYICDNEFQIVDNTDINTELPGTYRIQTMNGTDVDSSTLVLKPGITYRFQIDVDEEVCLSTVGTNPDRVSLSSGGVGESRDSSRNRERTLGCATRSGGPLIFNAGRDEITGPQIYVNIGAGTEPVFAMEMNLVFNSTTTDEDGLLDLSSQEGGVESSGHLLLPGAISGLVIVALVGLLI
jgi:hypothetical protein